MGKGFPVFDKLKSTLSNDKTRHAFGSGAKAIVIIALVVLLITLLQGMDGAFATIGFPVLFVLVAFAFLIISGKRNHKDDENPDPIHRKDARRDKMNKTPSKVTDDHDDVERRSVRVKDDADNEPVRPRHDTTPDKDDDIEQRLQEFRRRMYGDD